MTQTAWRATLDILSIILRLEQPNVLIRVVTAISWISPPVTAPVFLRQRPIPAIACIDGCKTCTNSIQCLDCYYPLSRKRDKSTGIDTCVSDCGLRYYALPARVCEECDFRCLSCLDGSNARCPDCDTSKEAVVRTSPMTCGCMSGFAADLLNGVCTSLFLFREGIKNQTVGCTDPLCMECDAASPQECFKCSTTVEGIVQDPVTKKCTCAAGKYREGNRCLTCSPLCGECTGPTNRDCVPNKCGSKAYPLDYLRTTCLYMCKTAMDDMYIDPTERTCKSCTRPCQSCFASGSESCSTCVDGYVLLTTICIDHCPDKYYSDSNICLPCDPKCKACVNRVNYCINGCEYPYLFKDNRCLTECGDGFAGVNGICEGCEAGCALCYYDGTRKVCTRCLAGKFLFGGKCSTSCPTGFYPDSATGLCAHCDEACTACFGGSSRECYSCDNSLGYVKIAENSCAFPSCTDGSYFNKTVKSCAPCPKECATCETFTNCTSCTKGYAFSYAFKKCYDPCNKLGFTRKENSFDCTEICGDGRNMGMLECDDGNTRDKDGCDSQCKVEPYYECTGGDWNHADLCISRKPVEVRRFRYFGNRTAVVTFEKKVKLLGRPEEIFDVSLENTEQTGVEWELVATSRAVVAKTMQFAFRFNHSLTGDENLVIRFKAGMITDLSENPLKNDAVRAKVYKYKYISSGDKNGAEGAGTVSLYAMLPSIGISLGLSLALY